MNKFQVSKMFAINSQVYQPGEIVELAAADAKALVDSGNLVAYADPAPRFTVEMDTKAISDAVAKGFAAFAPAAPSAPMDFGAYLQGIAKKTVNVGTTTQGGFATTTYVDPQIDVDLLASSGIASRARLMTLTGTNNIYKTNVVNSTGNAPAVTAEGNTINASQPTVTQFSFTLQKVTYRMDVTDEAIEDTGALVSEVSTQIPEEFSKYVELGMITGVGPFTGIIGDTNSVVVSKEAGQTDGTIVAENIDKLFSGAKNPGGSIWIMSRSAYAAIQGLEDGSGARIFQGPNGIADNVFGTLKGLPIAVSDYSPALGEAGDIILAELGKYRIVTKGGLRMASSPHILFLSDMQCFKFAYRLAGKPTGLKLTATDGTEVGNFLYLEQRGS